MKDCLKEYRVHMFDFAIVPLNGKNPRGTDVKYFDELDSARKFAEGQKNNWNRVAAKSLKKVIQRKLNIIKMVGVTIRPET